MQAQVRVVRAHVWLSTSALASADDTTGFLALTRACGNGILEQLAAQAVSYGSLEAVESQSMATRKRWQMSSIRWDSSRSTTSTATGSRVVVALDDPTSEVPVEIRLFMISSSSAATHGETTDAKKIRAREKQRIILIGSTSLVLSAKDLEAIDGSQEVVFKSSLAGHQGDVEVALRRVEDPHGAKSYAGFDAEQAGGTFSVHWTSSEALEKDLHRKEQVRRHAETKLIERLVKVEATTKKVESLRWEAVEILRFRRAATAIQRAYRRRCRRRREQRRREKRKLEEKERARKEAVRARVVARNQRRTQQLMEAWQRPWSSSQVDPESVADEMRTSSMNEWIKTKEDAVRLKLRATAARLREEKETQLAQLGVGMRSGQWDQDDDQCERGGVLSDSLIHAIQYLHLRK